MNRDDVSRVVLLQALEQDAAGVWEVLWDLNGKFPETSPARRRAVATDVIIGLLRAGLISAGLGTWEEGAISGPLPTDPGSLLKEDEVWAPPARGVSTMLISITEAGRDHYFGPGRGKWIGDEDLDEER